ncbi:hypothetical protein ACFYVL_42890 [Streptomyces sp. NPDC004111]|uniref:hypothetical protein n=1 Tax=Streptomyces sp. NPDC004111 TaxID=3364690 RepID=UPI00368729EA
MLADQLGIVARSPSELVEVLRADGRRAVLVLPGLHEAADAEGVAAWVHALAGVEQVRLLVEVVSGHPVLSQLSDAPAAVMDLDEPRWTDPLREAPVVDPARQAWRSVVGARDSPETDLGDPVAVCSADPVGVSTAYESAVGDHGGLRSAWLRAGQALVREQDPAVRALILRSALGDGSDPRVDAALASCAAGTPWEVVWRRTSGDIVPPWPGPVVALATTGGSWRGTAALADHSGVLRTVSLADAAPIGRLARRVPQATALCALPDGALWALDASGLLHIAQLPVHRPVSGLAALLDDVPGPAEQIRDVLAAVLARRPGTALAMTGRVAAVADGQGAVHSLECGGLGAGVTAAALHDGPVTALAAVDLPVGGGAEWTTLLYSGGFDGRVRLWAPGQEPMARPVVQRGCPVTALSAVRTADGLVLAVGWADGLIGYHRVDSGEVRAFRTGAEVSALAVTIEGSLVFGTRDRVCCLHPR